MQSCTPVSLYPETEARSKPAKTVVIPEGHILKKFLVFFLTCHSLSLTLFHYVNFSFFLTSFVVVRFPNLAVPSLLFLFTVDTVNFPVISKAGSKMWPQWSLEDVNSSKISHQETSRFEGYHNTYPRSSRNVFLSL